MISFPAEAMAALSPDDLARASVDSHDVIQDAKAAGVYVFGGGIDESVHPVLVSGDGRVTDDLYPGSRVTGGFLVLEVKTRAEAVEWARRVAQACQCAQELREFGYDPAS